MILSIVQKEGVWGLFTENFIHKDVRSSAKSWVGLGPVLSEIVKSSRTNTKYSHDPIKLPSSFQ